MINGHRLNDNVYDGALLGTEFPLDLDLIDRIEIVRGPSSSLFGTNAIFGVINVITRRPKNGTAVDVSGDEGSFLSRSGRLTGNYQKGALSAVLSGSLYRSAGQSDLFFPEFTRIGLHPPQWRYRRWWPPGKFIPIAEECGLIITLGAFIMEVACSEAVHWQAITGYPIQVAVNVSTLQFKRADFVQDVMGVLERSGLRPELLQIELTETTMMTGVHRASETMARLRAQGVTFAIDDFGTGYSCLSYLPSLPFNALKIDRAFVRELEEKPESRAMVNSLVALAHNIGIQVIVEGVETAGQLDLIKKSGGNEIQGFLTGRPTADPRSYLSLHLGKNEVKENDGTACDAEALPLAR